MGGDTKMQSDILKWGIATGLTVFSIGALYAADSRWLQKAAFNNYLQAQIVRDSQAELRSTERKLVDVHSELEYGILTNERKAQLTQLEELLEQQIEELKREINGLVE